MNVGEQALRAAGLALAHALWSVSDLEGDALCPLAIVGYAESQPRLLRFEAPTQEQAIARAKREMARIRTSPWAFARDGIIREGKESVDVLSVDCWEPGMEAPVIVMQRYLPSRGGGDFRLHGPIELVVSGRSVSEAAAAGAIQIVREGILAHSNVAELLAKWQEHVSLW